MTCWSCAHCFVRRTPRRYGFYLQEVADATGINFVHQAPTLDHKLDHIIRRVASMGGRFYRRFDRDGWQDIYRALLELSWEDVDFDQNCQWENPKSFKNSCAILILGSQIDTYVQAVTKDKLKAQSRVVKMLLPGIQRPML